MHEYMHVQCRNIIAILFILMNLQFYLQTTYSSTNLPLDSFPSHDGPCHRPHQGHVEAAIDFRQHFVFGDGLADGKQRSESGKKHSEPPSPNCHTFPLLLLLFKNSCSMSMHTGQAPPPPFVSELGQAAVNVFNSVTQGEILIMTLILLFSLPIETW